jgi:hypothetical protein
MKLVLNDKEIIFYLASLIDYSSYIKDLEMDEREIVEAILWSLERKNKLHKFREKIKDRIYISVRNSVQNHINSVNSVIESRKKYFTEMLKQNLEYVLEKLGEEAVLESYLNSQFPGFCKSPGLIIDPESTPIRRKNYTTVEENCIIRNTVGNEKILTEKIDRKLPFWFIDSGYTNFLESNKKWHRLVFNHIHSSNVIEPPVDRLKNFVNFPQPWRTAGDRILIIEPGNFSAEIFHVDSKTWRYQIEKELRKYTDKKIVFREKITKKKRTPLYQHLLDEDYYSVVNINSNAATEAIWAGIPVVTLDRHITNSVSKNRLSDINDLYRGSLASWLCVLSYSQFTYEELINGTAVNILKTYHV